MDAEVSAQLLAFAEQTTDFVGVADPWGRVLYLNPAARKRLGIADPTGLTLADVFPVDEFAFYYDVARPQLLRTGAWNGEVRVNVAGEGALPMYVSTTATVGPGGQINGLVVYAREVPRSDPVGVAGDGFEIDEATGLLTRAAFDDCVRRALASVHREGEARALVLVDIVGIGDTIETLGQLAAATIMRSLAHRLTRLARTSDTVGRLAEHQLGLLLGAVRSHGEALRIARMVYESLVDPPVTTAAGEVVASVSCGVAVSKPGDDPIDLMERAFAAMPNEVPTRDVDDNEALASSGRSDGSPSMDDFHVGFSHGEVQAYAQPVIELRSGHLVGYQGVSRWHHRRMGTLAASAFVDMIADTPLASQVDLYIARETAAVLTLTVGDTPLRMYTPVSRRFIVDVRTEQHLSEIAGAFFLSMDQIHLQVARPLLHRWSPALQDALESIRDADVGLVLTGVEQPSDVEALTRHPFDELHISRRLMNAAATDPDARSTVSEIVQLAHDRAVLVAATGVDTEQQRDLLLEAGCDLAAGDLFGRPEPASTID
jgi:diguanylate cyclase (GGDEF)-like protein